MSLPLSGVRPYSKPQFIFGAIVGAIGIWILIGTSADYYLTLPLLLISAAFTVQADRLPSQAKPDLTRNAETKLSPSVTFLRQSAAFLVIWILWSKLWPLVVDRYPLLIDLPYDVIARWIFAGAWLYAIIARYRDGIRATGNDPAFSGSDGA